LFLDGLRVFDSSIFLTALILSFFFGGSVPVYAFSTFFVFENYLLVYLVLILPGGKQYLGNELKSGVWKLGYMDASGAEQELWNTNAFLRRELRVMLVNNNI
jgi:hypothetical protein